MNYLPYMVRIVFVLFAVLSIEFRASDLLGKCSDTAPHLSPALHCWWVWLVGWNLVCVCTEVTLESTRGRQIPPELDLMGG